MMKLYLFGLSLVPINRGKIRFLSPDPSDIEFEVKSPAESVQFMGGGSIYHVAP